MHGSSTCFSSRRLGAAATSLLAVCLATSVRLDLSTFSPSSFIDSGVDLPPRFLFGDDWELGDAGRRSR